MRPPTGLLGILMAFTHLPTGTRTRVLQSAEAVDWLLISPVPHLRKGLRPRLEHVLTTATTYAAGVRDRSKPRPAEIHSKQEAMSEPLSLESNGLFPDEDRGRTQSRRRLRPWRFRDPRDTSTQSLLPSDTLGYSRSRSSGMGSGSTFTYPVLDDDPTPNDIPRRQLLVVYIHGYMGDTTSFKSFPAHVHGYLTERLRNSHAVHTKIYPRYKTYRPLQVAADEFGDWLGPNVDDSTDVVLVGHSMGGLIAADIVLLPPKPGSASPHPLRRRILGTVNCDSPFLGLNPRIAVAGIKSLALPAKDAGPDLLHPPSPMTSPSPRSSSVSHETFQSLSHFQSSNTGIPPLSTSPSPLPSSASCPSSKPELQSFPSSSSATSHVRRPTIASLLDPNYDPSFSNDAHHPARGFWAGLWNFSKKHRHRPDFVVGAAFVHMFQHFQYAWCLIDWAQLTKRYIKIRELEEEDPGRNRSGTRVRWVNYYTVCSGKNGPRGVEMIKEETRIRGTLVKAMESMLRIGKGKEKPAASGNHGKRTRSQQHENTNVSNASSNELPGVAVEQWVDGTVESVLDWFCSSSDSLSSSLDFYGPESSTEYRCIDSYPRRRPLSVSQLPSGPDVPISVDAATQTTGPLSTTTTLAPCVCSDRGGPIVQNPYPLAQGPESSRIKLRTTSHQGNAAPSDGWNMSKEEKRFKKELDHRLRQEIETAERDVLRCEQGRGSCKSWNSSRGRFYPVQAPKAILAPPAIASPSSTGHPPGTSHAPVEQGVNVGMGAEAGECIRSSKTRNHRRFCVVPSSISRSDNGKASVPGLGIPPDSAWVKVDMGNVDEVGAHCGLFKRDWPHYNGFLEDMCERIVGWVEEENGAQKTCTA